MVIISNNNPMILRSWSAIKNLTTRIKLKIQSLGSKTKNFPGRIINNLKWRYRRRRGITLGMKLRLKTNEAILEFY